MFAVFAAGRYGAFIGSAHARIIVLSGYAQFSGEVAGAHHHVHALDRRNFLDMFQGFRVFIIIITVEIAPKRRIAAYFTLLYSNWGKSMGNVKTIEKAVESLPPSELAEFRRWFAEFDATVWDRQIEQDAASGKLDGLAAEALADYRTGSAREL